MNKNKLKMCVHYKCTCSFGTLRWVILLINKLKLLNHWFTYWRALVCFLESQHFQNYCTWLWLDVSVLTGNSNLNRMSVILHGYVKAQTQINIHHMQLCVCSFVGNNNRIKHPLRNWIVGRLVLKSKALWQRGYKWQMGLKMNSGCKHQSVIAFKTEKITRLQDLRKKTWCFYCVLICLILGF